MAYKVIILYRLYMPPYFLGTFTEYPFLLSGCPDPVFSGNRILPDPAVYLLLYMFS